MGKKHGSQIKNDEKYEAMRKKGYSKEKAARITNAQETGHSKSKHSGGSGKYEEWSKQQLYDKAKKVGIEGRSKMSKSDLADALRNH